MNAYRFAVRSYAVDDVCYLHTDIAVSVPPGELESVLLRHRLQPVAGHIAAVGIFKTEKETRQAHEDLVTILHVVDTIGLRIAEDQGRGYCDRRIGALFSQPLVLEDDEDNIFILDIRPLTDEYRPSRPLSWQASDPLKKAGLDVAYLGRLSDGSHLRLSSATGATAPYFDQIEEWLNWSPSPAEIRAFTNEGLG